MTEPSLQPSLLDVGLPLSQVCFVVVDLETTGAGPQAAITEIGAVKARGGEILGEFQTLVDPEQHIPASISVLTGITDAMVAGRPTMAAVLPSFLAWSEGCVLVAHNASFDIGFLKRACAQLDYEWPGNQVVDTVALARQALLRDEVRNFKLGTLAAHFHTSVEPNHRALSDARATLDVLHGLLERVGNLGVSTLVDLQEFTGRVSPERRRKRVMAQGLPHAPGVYRFYADLPDRSGAVRRQVLYVGKSRDIASRVRTYFTAAETRARMDEMVRLASGVEATVCRTVLEAEILELRLIAAHSPPYNRRSKYPQRQVWLKLTDEPFPRLSVVRDRPDSVRLGPLSRRALADEAALAIYEAFPLRQCAQRISPSKASPSCALAELGRCPAPCRQAVTPGEYAPVADGVREVLAGDLRPVLEAARRRLSALVAEERFEEAGQVAARVEALRAALRRGFRIGSLWDCPQVVAAYPNGREWEIHVIRRGRLAAAAKARPGENPLAVAEAAVLVADSGEAKPLAEETERIADWLERPGVRLVSIDGEWAWPIHCQVASLAAALA
ncbi:MAG: DEDD exonuclease domain-containing protein [Propionibacteriaceae bacterium]|jgi:DNA polymerase-3 subunit epsilon|nr:DEDD exonuclease domain-containing protein [Propionibacteriaceae bacterium]